MLYLSGSVSAFRHPNLGWMTTPDTANRIPPGELWAYDNACYAHPQDFNWDRWQRLLQNRLTESPHCLFVVAPDIPFDAAGTIARFAEYRERLRQLDVPVAFCLQDGMGTEDVPWADIAAVFVGGSTEWKTGHEAAAIVAEAKARQKWAHMGRVNSLRRLRAAVAMGCDSVDGTFLKYAPTENRARLSAWFAAIERQPPLAARSHP